MVLSDAPVKNEEKRGFWMLLESSGAHLSLKPSESHQIPRRELVHELPLPALELKAP